VSKNKGRELSKTLYESLYHNFVDLENSENIKFYKFAIFKINLFLLYFTFKKQFLHPQNSSNSSAETYNFQVEFQIQLRHPKLFSLLHSKLHIN
jgi:hypothetical protein